VIKSKMDQMRDVKSLLTIKVLRLVRPTLVGPLPLSCDTHDLSGDLWERELKGDVTAVQGLEVLSLGQFLRLPQGFGNMYLGETFSCYVVVQNESPIAVTAVNCKVELQTQTQKFVLADNKNLDEMKGGITIDIIMNHEVKEMGKHMLIVTLSYSVPNLTPAEPIVLERYFKFQVKKPLDVKTKLYNAESDEVFLEAQVQNITSGAICLEKVDLEPSAAFNCIPMSNPYDSGIISRNELKSLRINSKPLWPNRMLDVDSSYQFLYRLVPKLEHARSATNIGKLDIIWRTTMGDRGRLQTSQLQRQPPVLNDLKLIVEKVPDISSVDKPFDATIKLLNTTTKREMELQLDLDSSTPEGYCWLGTTKTKLGSLLGSTKIDLKLSIFPIRTGLINISGIRITDLNKGEKFIFNDIAQVFVMQSVN